MTFKIKISQFQDYSKLKQLEMKQNQILFNGTYSNLALFFVGHKILKYFNDFYNWHLSVSLEKEA